MRGGEGGGTGGGALKVLGLRITCADRVSLKDARA